MGLYRALYENGDGKQEAATGSAGGAEAVPLADWLDACQNEYDVLVARVRCLDEILVKYKRKRSYLLPRKIDR